MLLILFRLILSACALVSPMTSCAERPQAPGYILLNLDKGRRCVVYKYAKQYTIASMRMIPLNLLTLYADLAQRVSAVDVPAASITRRMVGGQRRIYATFPGGVRKQVYLGTAGDPKAEARAIAHIRAADDARANRKTVTTLKRAGVPAPDLYTGRILAALAQGGLFERGVVLVGTAAFQLYPCVVGAYLSSGS